MDDFRKQLLLLGLDKGLLALLLGGLGVIAKRYLDRQAAQRAYDQRVAEERIRAYKEISRIVAEQLMAMARLTYLLDEPAETEAAKEKLAADFQELYSRLRESYLTEMPRLQADVIFVSSEVAATLIAYIEAFGGFMRVPHDLAKGETPRPPAEGLTALSARLSHALSQEIAGYQA